MFDSRWVWILVGAAVAYVALAGGNSKRDTLKRGKTDEEADEEEEQDPYYKVNKHGAVHVGWNREIDADDVERVAREILEKGPEAHIVIGAGVHGAKGHGYHKGEHHNRDDEFLEEDLSAASRLRKEYPGRRLSVYDLGSDASYDQFKEKGRTPNVYALHGECYGFHDSGFKSSGSGSGGHYGSGEHRRQKGSASRWSEPVDEEYDEDDRY